MTTFFRCGTFLPIEMDGTTITSMDDAAREFAQQAAELTYGQDGRVGSKCRRAAGPSDYSSGSYEVFIGTPTESGMLSGANQWLYIDRVTA